jgi:hypothetical protein
MNKFKVRTEDLPRRRHIIFLGRAVLANIIADKVDMWISKSEWEAYVMTVKQLMQNLGCPNSYSKKNKLYEAEESQRYAETRRSAWSRMLEFS